MRSPRMQPRPVRAFPPHFLRVEDYPWSVLESALRVYSEYTSYQYHIQLLYPSTSSDFSSY